MFRQWVPILSEAGTRPAFKLVTGISTGALIAPCAFAGKAYDEKLRTIYTIVSTRDIAKISKRAPWRSEAFQDTAPLADLIARDVNSAMLDDIAAAHARGQRLYIGTTNLDAQRLVVWNMGAIASSGHPDALELFKKIMLPRLRFLICDSQWQDRARARANFKRFTGHH